LLSFFSNFSQLKNVFVQEAAFKITKSRAQNRRFCRNLGEKSKFSAPIVFSFGNLQLFIEKLQLFAADFFNPRRR